MDAAFQQEVEALIETFAERLTGQTDPETVEKLKVWALYSHMHKAMPSLTAHWAQEHPDSKEKMRQLFEEIKAANAHIREQRQS